MRDSTVPELQRVSTRQYPAININMGLTARNTALTESNTSLLASVESVEIFQIDPPTLILSHLQHHIDTWPNWGPGRYMDSSPDTHRTVNAIWIPYTYLELR